MVAMARLALIWACASADFVTDVLFLLNQLKASCSGAGWDGVSGSCVIPCVPRGTPGSWEHKLCKYVPGQATEEQMCGAAFREAFIRESCPAPRCKASSLRTVVFAEHAGNYFCSEDEDASGRFSTLKILCGLVLGIACLLQLLKFQDIMLAMCRCDCIESLDQSCYYLATSPALILPYLLTKSKVTHYAEHLSANKPSCQGLAVDVFMEDAPSLLVNFLAMRWEGKGGFIDWLAIITSCTMIIIDLCIIRHHDPAFEGNQGGCPLWRKLAQKVKESQMAGGIAQVGATAVGVAESAAA